MSRIKSGRIKLAGYKKARIYGTLHCRSGKRMKAGNRVFFSSEEEAIASGYRPCGHCLPEKYKRWKAKTGLLNAAPLNSDNKQKYHEKYD